MLQQVPEAIITLYVFIVTGYIVIVLLVIITKQKGTLPRRKGVRVKALASGTPDLPGKTISFP